MSTFKEVLEFLWAVINNWAGYATGGLIVALVWLWSTLLRKEVPRKLGIGLALLFLAFAVFNAWLDKHRALLAIQENLKSPEFRMQINSAWWGPWLGNRLFVIVSGTVTNPHGPPSGALNWAMSIQLSNRVLDGTTLMASTDDQIIPLDGMNQKIVLKSSKYWPAATQSPIATGGSQEGWFTAVFSGLTSEELSAGAVVVVRFNDAIENKQHEARISILKGTKGVTLPGITP